MLREPPLSVAPAYLRMRDGDLERLPTRVIGHYVVSWGGLRVVVCVASLFDWIDVDEAPPLSPISCRVAPSVETQSMPFPGMERGSSDEIRNL